MMHNAVMELSPRSGTELEAVLARLVRLFRQLATPGRLSLSALSVLARLERDGPQRLTELAISERISQPGMSQLVGRLERDGLVGRSASSEDRRGVLVRLTDAGRELVGRRRVARATALRRLLDRLDPGDRTTIENALPALTRLVEAADPHEHGSTTG
jgi:DNA-binding MarR family transcriptional regulator